MALYRAGVDVGSTTVKLVIVDENNNILYGDYCRHCAHTQEKLAELTGKQKFGKLCIGPAGENRVRFASVLDGTHTSGRTGIGAVFGWKNLKAIMMELLTYIFTLSLGELIRPLR